MELPGAETRCSKTRYFLMEELTFYTYDSTDRISHPHKSCKWSDCQSADLNYKKKKKKLTFLLPKPCTSSQTPAASLQSG